MADITFGNLYDYSTSTGIIIPQTSDVKTQVETAMKQIFGDDFSTQAESVNGRLIEALTLLFIDILGVNAINASSLNITQAVGTFLDNLGANFGVTRLAGESDSAYRKRVIESSSRGSGFVQSIRTAVASVSGVTYVCVLENGACTPALKPCVASSDGKSATYYAHSITLAPNSVAVFVKGGTNSAIANALISTVPAGCAYTRNYDYGTYVQYNAQTTGGYNNPVYWHVPTDRYIKMDVTVSSIAYYGADISTDTKNAIATLIQDNIGNTTITKAQVIAAIASSGKNIIASDVTMYVSDTRADLSDAVEVDQIVLPAYKNAVYNADYITVTVQ